MTLEGKIPRKSIDLLPESTEANEGKKRPQANTIF